MNLKTYLLGIVLMVSAAGISAMPQTANFDNARNAFVERSGCGNAKSLEASDRHGEMSSCIIGNGRTVVWELEKARDDNGIQRIRFTWFDFGVDDPTEAKRIAPHVDQDEAERMVDAFLDTYAPCVKDQVRDGFFGEDDLQAKNSKGFKVAVQHFRNPSLVERVIEIRPTPGN